MFENGLDFIISSINHMDRFEKEESIQDLKYCILNLSSGIELLLKRLLFHEHWSYIIADVDKVSLDKFKEGDFISVDSVTITSRLEKLCNIKLSEKAVDLLKKLRNIRNKLEHYYIGSDPVHIKKVAYKVYNNFFLYINYEFLSSPNTFSFNVDDKVNHDISDKEKDMLQKLVIEMQKINIIEATIEKIALQLASEYTLPEELQLCPICGKKFMRYGLEGDICHCYYCGTNKVGEEIIDEYINKFSAHLFWDVRREDIDLDKHEQYVIKRVLEYGLLADWNLIRKYYGLSKIVEITKELRDLEPRALSYISAISKTPKEQFR